MLKLIIRFKPYAGYFLVATTILILIVSSIPSIPVLKIHTRKADIRLDYLIHICEYGFLSYLAFLTFTGSDFKITSKKLTLIALGVLCFAVIDEYHQKFIPGRTFNPKDLISNICGIICALVFCMIVFRKISETRVMQ